MSDPVVTMLKDIVANLSPADDEWRSMSMVIGFDGDFLNRTFGYTYSPDGVATSVSADPFAIAASTEDYLANTYEPGAPRPVRFLVQLDRVAGQYGVTFEDTDHNRWEVTPANVKTAPQELRPTFG